MFCVAFKSTGTVFLNSLSIYTEGRSVHCETPADIAVQPVHLAVTDSWVCLTHIIQRVAAVPPAAVQGERDGQRLSPDMQTEAQVD